MSLLHKTKTNTLYLLKKWCTDESGHLKNNKRNYPKVFS